MRRRLAIVIGIVLMVVVAVLWRCFDSSKQSAESAHRGKHPQNASHASRRPNPSSLLRGSIKGTVVDEAKKSVAGARVCAHGINDELDSELLREPADQRQLLLQVDDN